ncbi:hypothetical protein ABEF95_016849 [Exophiala dermatitidis]
MQNKPERVQDQWKHKISDGEAGKDTEGDEDIGDDYLETFSAINTGQQEAEEFSDAVDDDSRTIKELLGSPNSSGLDTFLGTRSPGESQRATPTLPEPTLGDLLTALAQVIAIWEAPEDLTSLYPESLRFDSLASPSLEEDGLNNLVAEAVLNANLARQGSSKMFDVEDFCIYRSPHHHHAQGQFDYLSLVESELPLKEAGSVGDPQPRWLLDGLVSYGGKRYELRAAEVIAVKTGKLDDCESRLSKSECFTWIMTTESKRKNVWYRLRTPSRAYLPFWSASKWLANFAEFFISYLDVHSRTHGVRLCDFQSRFWIWLCDLDVKTSQKWAAQCGNKTDYRQYILSHCLFLYKQAHVFGEQPATGIVALRMSHPIWSEIGILRSQTSHAAMCSRKTLVTSNVASSFSRFSAWQDHDLLEVVQLSPSVEAYQEDMVRRWKFPTRLEDDFCKDFVTTADGGRISTVAWILEEAGEANRQVYIPNGRDLTGGVVILRVTNSRGPEFNYAWVRKATTKSLRVIWLVLPADTICDSREAGAVFYPMGNELFFSDRCSCEEVSTDDVVRVVNASVFEDRATIDTEVFVRSLYRHGDEAITIATKSGLSCRCLLHRPRRIVKQPFRNSTLRDDKPKLRGLSLFSGCGLFDAAFTCNGTSEIVYATEICEIAARSYKANDATNRTHMEIGSVEDGFENFALGRKPMPDIDFIIGGFPCPFYSTLNHFKHTRKGQKDGSLVANMLSWIEIFMPPYVLMENVPNMDRIRPNACRQAICHLVALGYQVRKSVHNDANLGGVSIRQRLFIVAAAPGVVLPDKLVDTHGPGLRRTRTVSEAIGDLSPIDNDTDINILDPSHVPISRLGLDFARNVSYRSLVRQIPTEPKCMALSRTYYEGGLLAHQRRFFDECLHPVKQARNAKCLQRINPDKPFRTVCTVIAPMDARFCGHIIHPSQHRTLSLKEGGRRAMGMPDHYLLAGSVEEQYKQCGNAVPWTMGAAWGRNFARAWFASLDRRAQENNGGKGEMHGMEGHDEDEINFESSNGDEDQENHNSSDDIYVVDSGNSDEDDDGDDDKHDTGLDFENSSDGDDDDEVEADEGGISFGNNGDDGDHEDEDEDDDNNYQFDFENTDDNEDDHDRNEEISFTDSGDDGEADDEDDNVNDTGLNFGTSSDGEDEDDHFSNGDMYATGSGNDGNDNDDEDENNHSEFEFEDSSDNSHEGGSDELGHDYFGRDFERTPRGFNPTYFNHGDTTPTPEDDRQDSEDSDSSLEIIEVRPVKKHRMC